MPRGCRPLSIVRMGTVYKRSLNGASAYSSVTKPVAVQTWQRPFRVVQLAGDADSGQSERSMSNETTEPPKTTTPADTGKPVTEDELCGILDRLEATRDIFRENRELRSVLSRHEGEAQALRTRSAKLEEIMRQFAPALLTMATIMGMAAKNEKD